MRRMTIALTLAMLALAGSADAASVTFTKLTGITGGSTAGTAVYRADLSGLGLTDIQSITVQDNSFGLGGATGQFSGFDLDAVVLSTTLISDASQVGTLVPAASLAFASSLFTPGTQRAPVDAKLFGTNVSGNAVNNAVATLGSFDAVSSTGPDAAGFLSMGDGGLFRVNLGSATSTAGLYLYIGEVGDNGEVAAGAVTVSERPVPEPITLALLGVGLLGAATRRRHV